MVNLLCLVGGFFGGLFVPVALKTKIIDVVKGLFVKVKSLFVKK
jgi:hypothetical protein